MLLTSSTCERVLKLEVLARIIVFNVINEGPILKENELIFK